MKTDNHSNLRKAAIVVVAFAVAATCSVAGTLAAFGATYTWNSDSATTGDFGYEDTNYTIDIFGENDVIVPGDTGRSALAGPDFGNIPVEWSFSVQNDDGIPAVFYLLNEDGTVDETTLFSTYSFAPLAEFYVKGGKESEKFALSDISSDPLNLAAGLSVGRLLCWVWPSAFYTDAECTVTASSDAVDAYATYCKALCTGEYAFDSAIGNAFTYNNGGKETNFAIGWISNGDASGYYCEFTMENPLVVADGLIKFGDSLAHVVNYDGAFYIPASSSDLRAGAAVMIVFSNSKPEFVEHVSSTLTSAGVKFENLGKFTLKGNLLTPDNSGDRTIVKIMSDSLGGERATISLTVTATVAG